MSMHKVDVMNQKKPGFVMIMALMLASSVVVVVSYLATRTSSFVPFANTVVARQQAKMMVTSGVQIALAQLSMPPKKTESQGTDEQKSKTPSRTQQQDDVARQLFMQIASVLNRPQTVTFTKKDDGYDGQITLIITSEEGKIDINQVYDFTRHKFRGEKQKEGNWRTIMQHIFTDIQKQTGGPNLFDAFETNLKDRAYRLNDITEVLTAPGFSALRNAIWPVIGAKKEQKEGEKVPIYLTDIFTVHSQKSQINPWLFSDSLCVLFGLKRVSVGDAQQRKQQVKELAKSFKRQTDWKQEWGQTVGKFYGKDINQLPKGLSTFFAPQFDPKRFSVLVSATAMPSGISQRACAIVERVSRSQKGKTVYDCKIRRWYWL